MHKHILTYLFSILSLISVSPVSFAYGMSLSEPMTASDSLTHTSREWDELPDKVHLYWGNKDVHYRRADVPVTDLRADTAITVWRGERADLLAVAYSAVKTPEVEVSLKNAWPDSYAAWIRYVVTDEFNECGCHPDTLLPYSVPDMIDQPGKTISIERKSARPIWITLEVPRNVRPGKYPMEVILSDSKTGNTIASLNMDVNVSERTLPAPSKQRFHLNLWQQPYSVSRYYNVKEWSPEHFEFLRPYVKALSRAGQSAISAIIFYEPWGEQSNDKFSPMVETIRNPDGSWSYDYDILDKWIEFCGGNGLNGNIECFSMIPWDMNFRYFDKATGEYQFLKTTTDSEEYADLWSHFIKGLYNHAKKKGYADRLVISMDERPLRDMMNAYRIAKEAEPKVKMALAGNFHRQLADKLYTYSLTAGDPFPAEVLKMRKEKGLISTYYTSCSSPEPNIFSNNRPSDAAYLPLYCTSIGADGYLHWSFLNWTDNPDTDTRFKLYPPGDTYFFYPDGRPSIRYERMVEGIQLSEKLSILREEAVKNNDTPLLLQLEEAILPIRTGLTSRNVTTGDIIRNLHCFVAKF